MNTEEKLKELIIKSNNAPFLFVGSGLSRRYLNLPDWKGLLRLFSENTEPFEYYLSKAEGNMPKAAKLLAKDYHKYWWARSKAPNKETPDAIASISAPLKSDIANYLRDFDIENKLTSEHEDEITNLKKESIGGIITTNWDLLMEYLFPEYTVYTGQDELIINNPQWIAEIYKIHGCASKPQSLVLTSNDYNIFNKKSKYLASKLMTIFMEHPIIFIGYSMSDPNIISILRSLSTCLGANHAPILKNNLIFVSRPGNGKTPGIHETLIYADKTPIPATQVVTDNFSNVYRPLGTIQQRIPAKYLRTIKERLYEITTSLESSEKLKVLDIEKLDDHKEIEFVVGIGLRIQENGTIAQRGYSSLEYKDLARDILHDDQNFDADEMLKKIIPRLAKQSPYVPVFKYLNKFGINSKKEYTKSVYKTRDIDKIVNTSPDLFRPKVHKTAYEKSPKTLDGIITTNKKEPHKAAFLIPFLKPDDIDKDKLKEFLMKNEHMFENESDAIKRTYFRKLLTYYDRLKWGEEQLNRCD